MLKNIVIVFVVVLIIFYILLIAYLKIKLGFWRTQPVFHIYNLSYWMNPCGIISREIDCNYKYINHQSIKTYKLTDIKEKEGILVDQFCNFIKNYYLLHNFTKYMPSKNDIIGYLEGANHSSFITFYQEPQMLFQKGEVISSISTLKGSITARALNICFNKNKNKHKNNKNKIKFPTYYVDNLCVHPEMRKKGIASELIQTHYYNLRKNNSKIMTCLFKREGELTAIIPLTTYETYSYDISAMNFPSDRELHASIKMIEIGIRQLPLLVEFIKSREHLFECIILPDLTNVANMLKTENITIYALMTNGTVLSIYVFRNIQLYYNNRRATECTLALYSHNKELFVSGFNIAMGKMKAKYKTDIVLIEDTAQAYGLIDNFRIVGIPILFKSPTAFFLYNYACYSVKNREFMILY